MALGKRKPYLVQPDDPQDYASPEVASPYAGVGAYLREARLSYGRSTAEIGAALRIKPAHLDALERGEIEGMAGLTYALGYLRSYAGYLGLDGEAAVNAFKAELNRVPEPKPLVFPAPVQEAKFPTGRVLSLSVVLAVLVYGGFYFFSRSNNLPAEVVPAVPAELAEAPASTTAPAASPAASSAVAQTPAPAEGAAAPAPVDPTSAQAAPVAPAPAAQSPAVHALTVVPGAPAVPGALPSVVPAPPGSAPAPMPTDVLTAPPPAPPATTAAIAPSAPAAAVGEGRVVLKATAPAWVQILGPNQEVVFTKILRAGDSYAVPRADVTLVTGNAGALEIEVDGKPVGPIGNLGQVRRNVPLDPEKLLSGAARPPA